MFNFSFDPEQFASLGSSFDEPDPFATTSAAPAIDANLPTFTGTVDPNRVLTSEERKLAVIAERASASASASAAPERPRYNETSDDLRRRQDRNLRPTNAQTMPVAPSAPVATKAAPVKQTATDIVNFANNLQNTRQTAWADNGAGSYDANDWDQIAMITPQHEENYRWGTEQGRIWDEYQSDFRAYVEDNDIPLTQVRDGVTYYLTTDEEGRNDRELGGNYDNFLHGRVSDGVWIDQGPAGTYSTRYIDTSVSAATGLLNNPVMSIAASLIPGGTLALTAAKAANGQTLHGMDYASAALSGFELSKTLQAPATAAKAAEAGSKALEATAAAGNTSFEAMTNAANTAESAALTGKGFTLLGKELSYNASKGLINAVAVGDPKAAILGTFGGELVEKGLDSVGLTADVIEGKGIGYNDFTAGLTKVVEEVGNGRDMDEALALGLGKYIREGGTLGAGTADTLAGVVRDVVRPIGKAATELYRLLPKNFPKGVDTSKLEEVLSEANRLARQGASAADTLARKGLREFDKKIQPVTKPAGRLLSAADTATREVLSEADTLARQGLSAFDDAVIQPTGEFLSAADTAARKALTQLDEGLYDIQSPFSTPQFNSPELPDINLPSFNLDFGFNSGSGMLSGVTTGKIFGDELFKFKNKIELTEYGPMFQEQEVDIEDFLTSPFESAFTTSQRFA